MSAGIEHLIIQAAADKRLTCDGDSDYGFRLDDQPVDTDLSGRIYQLSADGLLTFDRDQDGSAVQVTDAGWESIR